VAADAADGVAYGFEYGVVAVAGVPVDVVGGVGAGVGVGVGGVCDVGDPGDELGVVPAFVVPGVGVLPVVPGVGFPVVPGVVLTPGVALSVGDFGG
jgi:hypothetical protein